MGRQAKPWKRKSTGWWMVELNGKQVRLSKDAKEAKQFFHRLMSEKPRAPDAATARVVDIVDAFLVWSKTHLAPKTHALYKWYGQKMSEFCGDKLARELTPNTITNWIEKHGWGQVAECHARRASHRFFSWAAQEKLLPSNPLAGMRRPKPEPRRVFVTDDEYRALLRASDKPFRRFLFALRNTGARPQEIRELTWDQVRADHLRLEKHKTVGKTKKPRIIHLNEPMQRFLRFARRHAKGKHVFLNHHGKPWTVNACRLQFKRLKVKLGLRDGLCAYAVRHGFATAAILGGVDVATVAELLGHSSTDVTVGVYIHLAEQVAHMQEAAAKATASAKPRKSSRRLDDGNEG